MARLEIAQVVAIRGRDRTVLLARFLDDGRISAGDVASIALASGDRRDVEIVEIDAAPRATSLQTSGPVIAIAVTGVAPTDVAAGSVIEVAARDASTPIT